jgi:hypothetical protein
MHHVYIYPPSAHTCVLMLCALMDSFSVSLSDLRTSADVGSLRWRRLKGGRLSFLPTKVRQFKCRGVLPLYSSQRYHRNSVAAKKICGVQPRGKGGVVRRELVVGWVGELLHPLTFTKLFVVNFPTPHSPSSPAAAIILENIVFDFEVVDRHRDQRRSTRNKNNNYDRLAVPPTFRCNFALYGTIEVNSTRFARRHTRMHESARER